VEQVAAGSQRQQCCRHLSLALEALRRRSNKARGNLRAKARVSPVARIAIRRDGKAFWRLSDPSRDLASLRWASFS
jgi:hypothetical protein